MERQGVGRGRGVLLRRIADSQPTRGPPLSSVESDPPSTITSEPTTSYRRLTPRVPFRDLQFSTDDDEPLLGIDFKKVSLGDDSRNASSSSSDLIVKKPTSLNYSDSEFDSSSSYEHFKSKTCEGFGVNATYRSEGKSPPAPSHSSPTTFSLSTADLQGAKQNLRGDYTVNNLVTRMEKACGIIHGDIDCEIVSDVNNLKLHPTIASILMDKKIKILTSSQMYGTPILLERRNLIFVGPPQTGKTFGAALAMMSLLLNEEFYINLEEGNGPRCVYLTSTSHRVKVAGDLCSNLAGSTLQVITAHGGGLEMERKVELTNGCDVLVSTPRCWLRLLQYPTVTNMNRLCHIVFDDADLLLSTFKHEMKTILNCFHRLLEKRKEKKVDYEIQAVVVGEKWTPAHEDCLRLLRRPVVAFTSHLEAALYSRINPVARIISSGAKINKLKELLSESGNVRTVVMCRSGEDMKQLVPHLLPWERRLIVAHETLEFPIITDICRRWEESSEPMILLCSDLINSELAFTNAQHLIHFTLSDSKSFFSERFSTIQNNFIDRVKHPELSSPACRVDILLDNENVLQFPEIIKFLERLNFPIPQDVRDIIQKIERQKEEEKADSEFCENILMFDKCSEIKKCRFRHVLLEHMDTPLDLPASGLVKMKMLYIHNPSHYSLRIVGVKPSESEPWQERKSNFAIIGLKMVNYYSNRGNRVPHGPVSVGDLVCVEVEMDRLFKRGLVLDVLKRDSKQNPVEVLIKLVDEGSVKKFKALLLLHLPAEFHGYEFEARDLYLPGISPVDLDPEWSATAVLKLRSAYSKAVQDIEDCVFIAKIALTVGDKMVAESFLCYEWLETSRCFRVLFSPRKYILNARLADLNPEHLPHLLHLAGQARLISLQSDLKEAEPKSTDEEKSCSKSPGGGGGGGTERREEEVRWARLAADLPTLVYVSFLETPSLFFLRLHKNMRRLASLEEDLNRVLSIKILKPDKIEEDMICAVKNPLWNRAMVIGVHSEEVDVIFVDYGDVRSVPRDEVSLLPEGFISRLPFQGIECSLVGIIPQEAEWTQDSIDFFNSLISNEKGEMKNLIVKVCEVKKSVTTGSEHYEVLLVDKTDSDCILLNKELILNALANWSISKTHVLNFKKDVDLTVSLTQSDEEEEKDVMEGSLTVNSVANANKAATVLNAVEKADLSSSSSDSEPDETSQTTWTEQMALDPEKVNRTWHQETEKDEQGGDIISLLQSEAFDIECSSNTVKEFSKEFMDILPRSVQMLLSPTLNAIENVSSTNGIEDNNEILATDTTNDHANITSAKPEEKDNTIIHKESTESSYEIMDTEEESRAETFTSPDKQLLLLEEAIVDVLGKELKVYKPLVVWSQNNFKLKISIKAPDIKEYFVYSCHEHVIFKCLIDDKVYAFDMKLFGPVKKEKTEYVLLGQHFDIKLEKIVPGPWHRLVFERSPPKWVKYDAGSLLSDEAKPMEIFLERALTNRETKEEYIERMKQREYESLDPYSRVPDIYSDIELSSGDSSDGGGGGPSDIDQFEDL